MMMYEFVAGIGVRFDGAPLKDWADKNYKVMKKLSEDYGGVSMARGLGVWTDNQGKDVWENNVTFRVAREPNPDPDQERTIITCIAEYIAETLEQQSVMIILPGGKVEFVELERN